MNGAVESGIPLMFWQVNRGADDLVQLAARSHAVPPRLAYWAKRRKGLSLLFHAMALDILNEIAEAAKDYRELDVADPPCPDEDYSIGGDGLGEECDLEPADGEVGNAGRGQGDYKHKGPDNTAPDAFAALGNYDMDDFEDPFELGFDVD